MTDRFEGRAAHMAGPATHGFAITPHDSTLLSETTRAIYVGGFGSVVVVLSSGAELTLANVPAGTVLPVRAQRVKATGTSATQLVGLV